MADTTQQDTMETLRAELDKLRQQLESIVKTAESKKSEMGSEILDRLTKELEHLRGAAQEQAHRIYQHGQAGYSELGDKVRENPMASLLIAFGAGCVLSCLFRHLK